MCDYSLQNLPSRPARLGEVLRTTSFRSTGTRGFAALQDATTAVCVMPGTELAFEGDVVWGWNFLLFRKPTGNLVRFRQLNTDDPYVHHDAVEFPDGRTVLLTKLRPGQRAAVVQLPVQRHPSVSVRPMVATDAVV